MGKLTLMTAAPDTFSKPRHHCGFAAPQQADAAGAAAGAQQDTEAGALSIRGWTSLPYTVLSPKVWNVSQETPLGSLTHPLSPLA